VFISAISGQSVPVCEFCASLWPFDSAQGPEPVEGLLLELDQMTELISIRENKTKKLKQASAKFLAFKAAFEKKAKEARVDFEEANRIWNETAKNLKW